MKTIAIIGGMGPQASVHSHKQLISKLTKTGKMANVVHHSIAIEPFFASNPKLELTSTQRKLLSTINADRGFIACNTAHIFFDVFEKNVDFRLENIIDNFSVPKNSVVYCSTTAKRFKLFGDVKYMDDGCDTKINELIKDINAGNPVPDNSLRDIVNSDSHTGTSVFACTELSMRAYGERLPGYDTLETTIHKIVDEL